MSDLTLSVFGELKPLKKKQRSHGHLLGKPETFASMWTHTHLRSGAESASGP